MSILALIKFIWIPLWVHSLIGLIIRQRYDLKLIVNLEINLLPCFSMDGSGAHNFMCLCATEVRMSRLVSPGRHQSHHPWLMSLGPISLHLVQERIGSQISLHLLHFLHCLPCNVYECDAVGNLRLRPVAAILNIWREREERRCCGLDLPDH